jgi:hypothetical protein
MAKIENKNDINGENKLSNAFAFLLADMEEED